MITGTKQMPIQDIFAYTTSLKSEIENLSVESLKEELFLQRFHTQIFDLGLQRRGVGKNILYWHLFGSSDHSNDAA